MRNFPASVDFQRRRDSIGHASRSRREGDSVSSTTYERRRPTRRGPTATRYHRAAFRRPRFVDWLRTARRSANSALRPVSVVCARYQRRRRTDRVQPGCAADVFANPWLLKNAALEPQRGRTAIANERRTFQSLDTSITSRRRGEPADPASVATIRVTGNPPYSIPSYSSRHGTREQLAEVIVMVGTIARTGFLRTGNGRSFRSVGFPRGREL